MIAISSGSYTATIDTQPGVVLPDNLIHKSAGRTTIDTAFAETANPNINLSGKVLKEIIEVSAS